jgi:hypothetical protein
MTQQGELFEADAARTLLDQLLVDSRLFRKSIDYKNLLDFIVRMRNFAPFNAMLLQIQKPGLRFAASAKDWKKRFGRTIIEDARPMLILMPFAPVALVYDLLDTEGVHLPEHVYAFPAIGTMTTRDMAWFVNLMSNKGLESIYIDVGDNHAGSVRVIKRSQTMKDKPHYEVRINRNHDPNTQFATMAHELGHLFLGHLGPDKVLNIPDRRGSSHEQRELEAESVSYLVCSRHGVDTRSKSYLANYVEEHMTVDHLEIYQITHATGKVEALLELGAHAFFGSTKH